VHTYARELLEYLIDYSWVTLRVEWLGIFGYTCLALQHHGLCLGNTLVPLFIHVVTQYVIILVPC
jgi:hypothetical protein